MNFAHRFSVFCGLMIATSVFSCGAMLVNAAELTPAQRERDFETHIRPILAEHCFSCHGEKKQWAELRLDSRSRMLKGGETGPAVVPGKPQESRLVEVIQYSENDSQMPPDGKLPDEQIARLTQWIADGAFWPEADEMVEELDYFEQAKTHWAFQPVRKPDVPNLPEGYRASNAIDHFIAVKLQAEKLSQSPVATPQTQLRRLAFDLNGLPASYEQTQEYAADATDERWQAEIERMLASPDFGEKWARYWLDIARYADTKGYVFTEERRYPFAYTYRDYVIKAFNEDLPYDQFIKEQLAADLLPEKRSEESLAALGFLTVGQRFLNRTPDIFDDRIDVTTRGLMGVTLACARCHDHKFDPLEAADYYALYGVFDSTVEPDQLPQIGETKNKADYEKFKTELDKREQAVADNLAKTTKAVNSEVKSKWEHYLLAVAKDLKRQTGRYELEEKYEVRKRLISTLKRELTARSADDPVFGVWRRLQGIADEKFSTDGVQRIEQMLAQYESGKLAANPLLMERLQAKPPTHFYDLVKLYAGLFAEASKADDKLADEQKAGWQQLIEAAAGESSPLHVETAEVEGLFHRNERNTHRNLVKKVDQLVATSPGAPPRAMVLVDKPNMAAPVIFKRGNPAQRGDRVERRFLKVLDFVRSEPFSPTQSGRLGLAEAIVSPENPLTARVLVNRVWMQLIGEPLVESTDDFGLRTPPPTHPELLDYLAYEFMQNGWSLKRLVGQIVSSETYRQTTLANPAGLQADPENRLVWRMNRRRLPFESMRDAMLLSAGMLDRDMYGRPESLEGKNSSVRRTVYGYIDRNNVSNLLRTFDVAGPNASVTQRPETSVPQQSLFVMNSPFILDLSQKLAERTGETTETQTRVIELYRHVLQRDPNPDELQICNQFVTASPKPEQAWRELAQTLLLTNEFLFLD